MTNVSAVEKMAELMQQMEENSPRVAALQYCLTQLEAKCAALAAENAGLKELIEQHANSVAVCPNCSHEEPSETDDIVALYRSMETPETEAVLAEVRAQGVEMLTSKLQSLIDEGNFEGDEIGVIAGAVYTGADIAAQIRKGVQS